MENSIADKRFIYAKNDMVKIICNECIHYYKNKPGLTCKAFPDSIPSVILMGEFDHTKPFPNDSGIQFERK